SDLFLHLLLPSLPSLLRLQSKPSNPPTSHRHCLSLAQDPPPSSSASSLDPPASHRHRLLLAHHPPLHHYPLILILGFVTLLISGDKNRMDILNDLPENILHLILSLLDDTRSSVRTSILSRNWRYVWKYVPALTFDLTEVRSDFDRLSFEHFLEQVLSVRADGSKVSRVTVAFCGEKNMDLLDMITEYAASHGVEKLFICCSMFEVVGFVSSCYQSLKVLKLTRVQIDMADVLLWSRFQLLESLTLTGCYISNFDVVAIFPRLEILRLVNCGFDVLKVSCPKLLNLIIHTERFGSLEIDAPMLQSFTLESSSLFCTRLIDVSKSNLPSLHCANIKLFGSNSAKQRLVLENLFKILHNVQALNVEVEPFQLLIETVKHQSSPFTRMKSLNLTCLEKSLDVPDEVTRYFLGSSPNEEDKCFTVLRSKWGRLY
ncbi:F-box/LRR-repeat protein 25, partial [Linum grandiflorum]